MRDYDLMTTAVEPPIAVVRAVTPDQLDLPTPCGDFTVRTLLEHMLGTAAYLASAVGAEADSGSLEERYAALTEAYSEPSAWEGEITMGEAPPMPAPMIGAMALAEVLLHGWDLAQATGRSVRWDPALISYLDEELTKTAELGRKMGAYGPRIAVAADAPPLDRVLGLTGRDPRWTA
ncbi:TIGR03086 family metal-binding protein [Actinoplanes sp. NPDC051494]|uniref:TIGR03086 family metal-binding protein n=1 Tax=Actinoplanes sp. NPDC051494 TaxID=3363907 RepID=UPI0037B66624